MGDKLHLSRAVAKAAASIHATVREFLEALRQREPAVLRALLSHSVIAETYFFRHNEQFDALRHLIVRGEPTAKVKIWSAGCASGEEAYSLAMMLLECNRAPLGNRVLGTDVSAALLEAAKAGLYVDWSLRQLSSTRRHRFFMRDAKTYSVKSEVRAFVTWAQHNLISASVPGTDFDIVVCRNVLYYFDAIIARRAIDQLVSALKIGGVLLLGVPEFPLAAGHPELVPFEASGCTLYRRIDPSVVTAAPSSAPPVRPAAAFVAARPSAPMRPSAPRAAVSPSASSAPRSLVGRALAAAQAGELESAARLARDAIDQAEGVTKAYQLLAVLADGQGRLHDAIEALKRALYLDPELVQAHASLVSLYRRVGLSAESERERRITLRFLETLADDCILDGLEPITVGALRHAFEA